MKLSEIKGLGPKRLALLEQMHIRSCEDLVRCYPQEYLYFDELDRIADAEDGQAVTLRVTVLAAPSIAYFKGRPIVSARAADASGKLSLRWLNQPYRVNQIEAGAEYFVHGRVSRKRGTVLYNPQVQKDAIGIQPVYNLPKGITQAVFRDAVKEAIRSAVLTDFLPEETVLRLGLMPLREAISEIHAPSDRSTLERAVYRVRYETALLYFLAVGSLREEARLMNGFAFDTEGVLERYLQKLPFTPTDAQLRVMREVEEDMASNAPMNRLIQGDVGSGKTVIAEYALAVAAACQKQGVLLTPTEILAEQHFRTLRALFGSTAALYTGSLSQKTKTAVRERIESGDAAVVVGTHALLSDNVRFFDLGVVVTDEQHRFGVGQRAKMEAKGVRPDVLVMSATPIPRTLALLLYADLQLSVLDEMPKGRKPVQTMFVPKTRREAMYRYIAEQIGDGERAYVVCPLIDETEGFEGLSACELFAELQKLLPGCPIGLLHGRMKDAEKNAVMEDFRSGTVKILVSTTVVEVGVDVKEATYMVIEGADHFGLATLHQLRGRVGRSEKQSYCYLLCDRASEHARERIKTMVQSNDGFYLARKDLEMRGFGDLFGVRQSGEGEFGSFLETCPEELLKSASDAAKEILAVPSVRNNEMIRLACKRYYAASEIARN